MSDLAKLPPAERHFLEEAAGYLERPRFLMKVANLVGKPAEGMLQLLPNSAQKAIGEATHSALQRSLDWAVKTLPDAGSAKTTAIGSVKEKSFRESAREFVGKHSHTALAATTGAVGGLFGLAGISVEIPATTTVMMRSIARIAAESGADVRDPATQLQCLSVFSLGSSPLDKMESAYLTSRLGLSMAMKESMAFFAKHTAGEVVQALSKGTAPVLVRLLNSIAAKFEIVLTQKVAAQAVPVAGAAMGALINAAFTDHFNRVARYHFGIVQMERRLGKDLVQNAYREACRDHREMREHPVESPTGA